MSESQPAAITGARTNSCLEMPGAVSLSSWSECSLAQLAPVKQEGGEMRALHTQRGGDGHVCKLLIGDEAKQSMG